MGEFFEKIVNFLKTTGIFRLFVPAEGDTTGIWWQTAIMFVIAFVLIYLALVKKFEPLLLLPIAIGMLLTNLPGANMFHLNFFIAENINYGQILHEGGLLDLLYLGVKLGIYPCLIFIGSNGSIKQIAK